MRFPAIIRLACAALTLGACSAEQISNGDPVGGSQAQIQAVNASAAPVTVYVDGAMAAQGIPVGGVSTRMTVSAGSHQIRMESSVGTSTTITAKASAGALLIAVGTASASSGVAASVLSDTGAIVPAGKSKLRVVHLSANAGNIEIWRTQPDYQTPVHIMTPFNYRDESPYLQSDAGNWEVFVTAAGSTTKLATTGAISIPSGERRTAILMDSAGVRLWRVITE